MTTTRSLRPLIELLRCVAGDCGGPLRLGARAPVLTCQRCPAIYPVVGGVPIVVPAPSAYLASYRDAVLATLAEFDLADRATVALVDTFAAPARPTEPLGFGDDWLLDEAAAARPRATTDDAAIAGWLAAVPDPSEQLRALVPTTAKTVVEIGCGGNDLARRLLARGRRVVAADLSLRAVLRTIAGTAVAGVVIDAAALPFAPDQVDALLAANLVDLLDDVPGFLTAAATALATDGRVILSTPDPALGTDDDAALPDLLAAAGLRVVAHSRGVAWLRAHSARHYQLYFADVIVGARAISARDRRPRRGRGRDRSPARARGRARSPSS